MYLDSTTIMSLTAIATALMALVTYLFKGYKWYLKQEEQDTLINEMRNEQRIMMSGLLACLKGLSEQGCNGPVTDAVVTIEKHLNDAAHKI